MRIEKLEDLNSTLAAIGQAVAKLRGGEGPAVTMRCHVGNYSHHLANGWPKEEMIMCHLVCPTHAPGELQQTTNVIFWSTCRCRDVAHSRRAESFGPSKHRRNLAPSRLIHRRQPHRMRREPNEG